MAISQSWSALNCAALRTVRGESRQVGAKLGNLPHSRHLTGRVQLFPIPSPQSPPDQTRQSIAWLADRKERKNELVHTGARRWTFFDRDAFRRQEVLRAYLTQGPEQDVCICTYVYFELGTHL